MGLRPLRRLPAPLRGHDPGRDPLPRGRLSPTDWLDSIRRLQAVAQNGLLYASDPFDVERYEEVRALAAELAAQQTDAPADRLEKLYEAETGHATPKLDVRGAAFRGGRVLLVRGLDSGWTLPGGWVEVGERPRAAIEKEFFDPAELPAFSARISGLQVERALAHHREPSLPAEFE